MNEQSELYFEYSEWTLLSRNKTSSVIARGLKNKVIVIAAYLW